MENILLLFGLLFVLVPPAAALFGAQYTAGRGSALFSARRPAWSARKKRRAAPKGHMGAAVVLLIIIAVILISGRYDSGRQTVTSTGDKELLQVHFIDVGQADSALIIFGEESMLIDAGNNDDGGLVVKYIEDLGITRLDYVIATHPHEDHIGGMDNVIKAFDIGRLIMPRAQANTKTFEDVLDAIAAKGLRVTTPVPGTKYGLGSATFNILAPNGQNYSSMNDFSVVVRLNHEQTSFLFMGDAEELSENEILKAGFTIRSDVLKVGHHGSATSTSEEFLAAVDPEYAVISVGEQNSYGHPAQKVLERLEQNNIKILRTDEQGHIIASSDGRQVVFDGSEVQNQEDSDLPARLIGLWEQIMKTI